MIGTYQPSRMQSSCIDCPAGYYCKNKVSELVECPPRYYCPSRTEIPILCPNGTFSENKTGLVTAGDCPPCPAGSFCKTGKYRKKLLFNGYLAVFCCCFLIT